MNPPERIIDVKNPSYKGVRSEGTPERRRLILDHARDVSYSVVHVSQGVFARDEPILSEIIGTRPALLCVDQKVDALFGDKIRKGFSDRGIHLISYLQIDGQESEKNWRQVDAICTVAIEKGFPRHGVFTAIGGGVTLDLVGFAASIFRRGVEYLRIPTTLIGLVDVGVGVKQAINHSGKKNIVGSFYPPLASINDPQFLRTLGEDHLVAGCAEILKIALVKDGAFFHLVEEYARRLIETRFQEPRPVSTAVLIRSARLMMEELQSNLYEHDLRRPVDFGHTFSPLIEAKSDFTIAHGEAVGIDMLLSTFIACRRGLCDEEVLDRLLSLYRVIGLPTHQEFCDVQDLQSALAGSRAHRGGDLNLVVPTGLGSIQYLQAVDDRELREALAYFASESPVMPTVNFTSPRKMSNA